MVGFFLPFRNLASFNFYR